MFYLVLFLVVYAFSAAGCNILFNLDHKDDLRNIALIPILNTLLLGIFLVVWVFMVIGYFFQQLFKLFQK